MTFEILWKGWLMPSDIEMVEVSSTLKTLTEEQNRTIKAKFDEAKSKNPHFYDGPLWRFEGVKGVDEGVSIFVSPTTYLPHNVLRNEKGRDKQPLIIPENIQYPNPASINAVPVTSDNFAIIGIKGGISDQVGLGAIGGFLKRYLPTKEMPNPKPESIFSAVQREIKEESTLVDNDMDIFESRVMGAIYGSNKDTTFATYLPVKPRASEITLKSNEHAATISIPATEKRLELFLEGYVDEAIHEIRFNNKDAEERYNKGKLKMVPVDHCYGDLSLLLENKKAERI